MTNDYFMWKIFSKVNVVKDTVLIFEWAFFQIPKIFYYYLIVVIIITIIEMRKEKE